jgi:hypothetical protein
MRGKFRTIVRTNGVLGRFLEFIVHTPLGKHETRHTITIRSHSRTVDAGTRSVASPKADLPEAVTFFHLQGRENSPSL